MDYKLLDADHNVITLTMNNKLAAVIAQDIPESVVAPKRHLLRLRVGLRLTIIFTVSYFLD